MPIHPLDGTVIVLYLLATLGIGLWLGRRQHDLSDYLLGGRNLPWWALLGSIVATETSTATFLSVPGLSFRQGGNLQFLQLGLGYMIGRVLVVAVLLPLFFEGRLFTAYQVLEHRFGGATKQLASALFLVTRNLGDGLRLFLTAIALEKTVDISLTAAVIVIGLVTIGYTVVGGMRSVVWNDCLQFLIYMLGGIAALILIIQRLPGGWSELVQFAEANDKFQFWSLRPPAEGQQSLGHWLWSEPYSLYAGVLGGMFLTFGTHGTDQMMVQRYLCARSFRGAAAAIYCSGVVVTLQFALFLLVGVGLAAYFQAYPLATEITRGDEVFAEFIVHQMPLGLAGLTMAAVFAAAMSTLSSSLNSSAGAVVNDFLPARDDDAARLRTTRRWTVVFGLVQMGLAIAAQALVESVVQGALAIAGFSAGVLLGIFLLGVLTKASQAAAVSGLLAGLIVLVLVRFRTDVAFLWLPILGVATTMGTGVLVNGIGRLTRRPTSRTTTLPDRDLNSR